MNEFRIKQKLSDLHLDILKRFNLKDRKESEDLWGILETHSAETNSLFIESFMREGVLESPKSKFMEEWEQVEIRGAHYRILSRAINKLAELIDKHKADK